MDRASKPVSRVVRRRIKLNLLMKLEDENSERLNPEKKDNDRLVEGTRKRPLH